MEAGIVGLSFVGKTTLFNALTALGVDGASGSGRPNIGVVKVPDPRLDIISQFVESKRIVPASLQLVDVAGLVAGASKGEGLGNRFLSHVRNVDALLHVVRCFEDPDIPHIHGSVNPVRDVDEVETELMLADLEQVETMLGKAKRQARTGADKEAKLRLEVLEACDSALGEGKPVSSLRSGAAASDKGQLILKGAALLTNKPVLYVANVAETDLSDPADAMQSLEEHARARGRDVIAVCAKLEAELAELEESERAEMLQAMGLDEPVLAVLARATLKLLDRQCFFTCGPKEIRAWTIPIGATSAEAAGEIHTDIQRGFIRNEVFTIADLQTYTSEQAIRAAGHLRVEGKHYVVEDGDICHFLFNV